MEKKVPERKVSLQDGDVFYVYDKRINKCIKEDCDGTVKYGLILKVSMTKDETCNCFECNKCHMKYTPYPNYVRISEPGTLTIYNQAEVTARDEKRAEDAKKQAAREKKEFKQKSEKRYDKKFEKRYNGNSDKKPEGRRENKEGFKRKSNIIIAGDARKFDSGSGYRGNSRPGFTGKVANRSTSGPYKKGYNNNYKNNSHQD